MFFNNPIPRTGLPKFHESTNLRSPRDSDAIPRVWQKNRKLEEQIYSMAQNLEQVQRQLNRLRRRGQGGGDTFNIQFRGEYSPSADYEVGDQVVVASGANTGTYVCVKDHPTSSNSPWLGGGWWVKMPSGNALGQWM